MSEKSVATLISELRDLIVSYVRQEVLGPLRGAGRYVARGLVGGLIGVVAGVFASVGLLRVAQTANVLDIDDGAWSWAVYAASGLACLMVGILFVAFGARTRRGT